MPVKPMLKLLPRRLRPPEVPSSGNAVPSRRTGTLTVSGRILRALQTGNLNRSLSDSTFPLQPTSSNGGGALLRTLLLGVIAPTILVFLYYVSVASDVYVTEVKLTVRKSQEANSGETSSFASSIFKKLDLSSADTLGQDTQIISDYLKSRVVIDDLGGKKAINEYFSRNDIDILSRLDVDAEKETVWEYWKERVTVSIDSVSNILTMRVRAYSRDDAYSLANKLILNSEKLINRISDRTKNDALRRANEEVNRSASELADVRTEILHFQQESGSIDPTMAVKQITTAMTELSLKKIQLESQIDAADLAGLHERPGDKYIETKVKVIEDQIQEFSDKLTGLSKGTLSQQLKEYQLLKLREEFSEKIYMLARSDYEQARRRTISQQLYVVVVVPPLLPERALFPRPILDTFVVFLGLFVLWGIGSLLAASVKDSRL